MKAGPLLVIVATCALASFANANGLYRNGRKLASDDNTSQEQTYFTKTMSEADGSVVIATAGPFKLEAACKTATYEYYNNSTSPTLPYAVTSTPGMGGGSSGNSSSWSEDDFWMDEDMNRTENYATLQLTYTATSSDYLYGSPVYPEYPDEDVLVGEYKAKESRSATVFYGSDGGYGSSTTLQTISGHYFGINGGDTIGIHKSWANDMPGGNSSFPKGVDCMVAGWFTHVVTPPNNAKN